MKIGSEPGFATPEALGDTIHALLQLDIASYDAIYEDDAISVDEALSLLGITDQNMGTSTVLAIATATDLSIENFSANTENLDLFSINIHEPDDQSSVASDIVILQSSI